MLVMQGEEITGTICQCSRCLFNVLGVFLKKKIKILINLANM